MKDNTTTEISRKPFRECRQTHSKHITFIAHGRTDEILLKEK